MTTSIRHFSAARRRTTTSTRLFLILPLGLCFSLLQRSSAVVKSQCLSQLHLFDRDQNSNLDQVEYLEFINHLSNGTLVQNNVMFPLIFHQLPIEMQDNYHQSVCLQCTDESTKCDCDKSSGIDLSLSANELDHFCEQTKYTIAHSQNKNNIIASARMLTTTLSPTPYRDTTLQFRQVASPAPTSSFFQCTIAMSIFDADRDSAINKDEYVKFVNRLSGNQFADTFDLLPIGLASTYTELLPNATALGIDITGSRPGAAPSDLQLAHLQLVCDSTTAAILLALSGGATPTAPATTPPTTVAPITPAPIPATTEIPIMPATPAPIPATTPAPLPATTEAPILPATPAPLPATTPATTKAPITSAPLPATTEAPILLATPAPLPATTEAPILPATTAPLPTTTEAPILPATPAPLPATTEAPILPTTSAPLPATTEAPILPTTSAPLPATTEAPILPVTSVPIPATTEAPITSVPIPATTKTPITSVPIPATTKAPITSVPKPATTKAPITSVPKPATTKTPITSVPIPATTEAPITSVPIPATTEVPITSVPVPATTEAPILPGTSAPISASTEAPTFEATTTADTTPSLSPMQSPASTPVQIPNIDFTTCFALINDSDLNKNNILLRKEYVKFCSGLSGTDAFSSVVFTQLPVALIDNYEMLSLLGGGTGRGIVVVGVSQNSTKDEQAFLEKVCLDTKSAIDSVISPVPTTNGATHTPVSLSSEPVATPQPSVTTPTSLAAPTRTLTDAPVTSTPISPTSSTDAPILPSSMGASSIPTDSTSASSLVPSSSTSSTSPTTAIGINGQFSGNVTFLISNMNGFNARALRFGGIRNSLRRSMDALAQEVFKPKRIVTGGVRERRRLTVAYLNESASIDTMLDVTCQDGIPTGSNCIVVNASVVMIIANEEDKNVVMANTQMLQQSINEKKLQRELDKDSPDSPITIEAGDDIQRVEPLLFGYFTVDEQGFWTTTTLLAICYSSVFLCFCTTCFCYLNRRRKVPDEDQEETTSSERSLPKNNAKKTPTQKKKEAKKREADKKKEKVESDKKFKKDTADTKKQESSSKKQDKNGGGGMFDSMTSGATGMKNKMAMAAMKAKMGM